MGNVTRSQRSQRSGQLQRTLGDHIAGETALPYTESHLVLAKPLLLRERLPPRTRSTECAIGVKKLLSEGRAHASQKEEAQEKNQ